MPVVAFGSLSFPPFIELLVIAAIIMLIIKLLIPKSFYEKIFLNRSWFNFSLFFICLAIATFLGNLIYG